MGDTKWTARTPAKPGRSTSVASAALARQSQGVIAAEAPAGRLGEPTGGRVAVVSGGNRGLGLQIVRALAERGMRVVLGTRSLANGWAALAGLGDLAKRVAVQQLDITDAASVTRFALWLDKRLGRCDVLVNNAAVLMDDDRDTATTIDLGVVERTLRTNLLGTWRLSQALVPFMRTHRYGRIVNVSSDLDRLAAVRRGLPAYRISKSAINVLTLMLADELAADGVLVNACYPGPMHAEFHDDDSRLAKASPDTPVWLATLPNDGPSGGFYHGRTLVDW